MPSDCLYAYMIGLGMFAALGILRRREWAGKQESNRKSENEESHCGLFGVGSQSPGAMAKGGRERQRGRGEHV